MIAPSLHPTRFVAPSPSASMKSIMYSDMVTKLKGSLLSVPWPFEGNYFEVFRQFWNL